MDRAQHRTSVSNMLLEFVLSFLLKKMYLDSLLLSLFAKICSISLTVE